MITQAPQKSFEDLNYINRLSLINYNIQLFKKPPQYWSGFFLFEFNPQNSSDKGYTNVRKEVMAIRKEVNQLDPYAGDAR